MIVGQRHKLENLCYILFFTSLSTIVIECICNRIGMKQLMLNSLTVVKLEFKRNLLLLRVISVNEGNFLVREN